MTTLTKKIPATVAAPTVGIGFQQTAGIVLRTTTIDTSLKSRLDALPANSSTWDMLKVAIRARADYELAKRFFEDDVDGLSLETNVTVGSNVKSGIRMPTAQLASLIYVPKSILEMDIKFKQNGEEEGGIIFLSGDENNFFLRYVPGVGLCVPDFVTGVLKGKENLSYRVGSFFMDMVNFGNGGLVNRIYRDIFREFFYGRSKVTLRTSIKAIKMVPPREMLDKLRNKGKGFQSAAMHYAKELLRAAKERNDSKIAKKPKEDQFKLADELIRMYAKEMGLKLN